MTADAMRAFWDRKAKENAMWFIHSTLDFAAPDADTFWRSGEETLDATLAPFGLTIRPTDRVIEIGCGIGRVTRALATRAQAVTAVDVSEEMIRRAREENAHLPNVDWRVNSGEDLNEFPDQYFTMAYSFIVFQHIPDPAVTCAYVREIGRVLAPGGWAVFQVSGAPEVHRTPRRDPWRARLGRLVGRHPRGCNDVAWLGSAVDRDDLLAAVASGGLELVATVGDHTQFCLVHARKEVQTAAEVETVPWYHTLDLGNGVVTPGEYDLRPALRRLPLPESLAGKRCLDVGTHDGFWAFEMERRGATEVVGIDVADATSFDWPLPAPHLDAATTRFLADRREAFGIAKRALRSSVERVDRSVYDLSVDDVGTFDFAVIGTLLLHLRDPIGALMALRRVVTGQLLVNEPISMSLTALRPRIPAAKLLAVRGAPFWWLPNVAALRRYVRAAGFDIVASGRPYLVANGAGREREPLPEKSASGAARMMMMRLGSPHAFVLATPATA